MVFLLLRKEAIFNATGRERRILYVLTKVCFALDRIATMILQAGFDTILQGRSARLFDTFGERQAISNSKKVWMLFNSLCWHFRGLRNEF
jgi:hypothetical protein